MLNISESIHPNEPREWSVYVNCHFSSRSHILPYNSLRLGIWSKVKVATQGNNNVLVYWCTQSSRFMNHIRVLRTVSDVRSVVVWNLFWDRIYWNFMIKVLWKARLLRLFRTNGNIIFCNNIVPLYTRYMYCWTLTLSNNLLVSCLSIITPGGLHSHLTIFYTIIFRIVIPPNIFITKTSPHPHTNR